jgi:hypothetical protein
MSHDQDHSTTRLDDLEQHMTIESNSAALFNVLNT